MNFSANSDENLTMLATEAFDQILETIRTSCLNFQMQISPFSAVISLKKSLIKDKSIVNFRINLQKPTKKLSQSTYHNKQIESIHLTKQTD